MAQPKESERERERERARKRTRELEKGRQTNLPGNANRITRVRGTDAVVAPSIVQCGKKMRMKRERE